MSCSTLNNIFGFWLFNCTLRWIKSSLHLTVYYFPFTHSPKTYLSVTLSKRTRLTFFIKFCTQSFLYTTYSYIVFMKKNLFFMNAKKDTRRILHLNISDQFVGWWCTNGFDLSLLVRSFECLTAINDIMLRSEICHIYSYIVFGIVCVCVWPGARMFYYIIE